MTLLLTIFALILFTAEGRPHSNVKTWLDEDQELCIVLTFIPLVETIGVLQTPPPPAPPPQLVFVYFD